MSAFQVMKQSNCALILRLLRNGSRSRAELARQTGLTRAAITGLADELIGAGLLREGAVATTAKGRRPILLELDPNAYTVVGIDISREGVSLCFLDFAMQAIYARSWDNTVPRARVLDELTAAIADAAKRSRLLGIGVVAPGPVDSVNGKILKPDRLDAWHGFCVSELEERLALPALLKKDTAALAIAEKSRIGAASSFLVLLADHGLGGGFIYQGKLFGSSAGLGCEIGHVSIHANGELCSCGSCGCAELYASIPSVLARAKKMQYDCDWSDLVGLAVTGDPACRALLEQQADALADVCVGAVNMLEPESIILEGKLCAAHGILKARIESALSSRCFTENGRRVRVLASTLPPNARAVAAGNLVLESFFEENWNDHIRKL